jgi:tight adherence protein B
MTALIAAVAVATSVLLVRRPGSALDRLGLDRLGLDRLSTVPSTDDRGRVSATVHRWRQRRDGQRQEAEVVEVVFALAAELRSGRPPGRALTLVSTSAELLRPRLAVAAAAVDAGARPADELGRLAVLPGCAGLHAVAAAWAVTESAGGAVADVLDRLGEALETERQARDTLDAALAGPRATMTLLAGLPVLGLVLGESLGAHPVGLLLHHPIGWALLASGLVLDAVGVLWTRALVHRALR